VVRGRSQAGRVYDRPRCLQRHDLPGPPRARQADGILLWDLKRFARNLLDSQFYKADLRRRGWTLIFLSDDIPETDFAPVYEALLEWKAQKDRDDIAKDVKRGLHALAQMGYAPGGFPPRGYKAQSLDVEIEGKKRQVRRWVPDPEWWDVARRAWEIRAAGSSLSEIQQATHIYRSRNCLTAFFANKTYLGIRKCGETGVEGAHEPLITREIWDAVQRGSNRRSPSGRWVRHPRRVGSPFLLSGLLYYQLCGASMNGGRTPARKLKDGNRAEWRFYMCAREKREYLQACPSRRLKAELVEDAVLHTVLSTVLAPQHLLQLLEETNEALNDRYHDLTQRQDQLQYQLERQDERMSRLLDALELGESAAVRDRLQRREAERAV
jgi:site-specific DNA recombinase